MRAFADYHTHTIFSHGKGTVAENVRAALERGLREVGISEHGPASLFGVGVSDLACFDRIRQEVAECQANDVDVVTHPGYRLSIDTFDLARACARRGTALEINTGHPHITEAYIHAAAAAGADFIVGSDAHVPGRVGDLDAGLQLAARAGLGPERVRNAISGRVNLYCRDGAAKGEGS